MDNDLLAWIQQWYLAQTDGDWEHCYGVEIETLDNPGWAVRIGLDSTALEYSVFQEVESKRSETDWIKCWVGSGEAYGEQLEQMFQAYCGPLNLTEVLGIFRQWAEGNTIDSKSP